MGHLPAPYVLPSARSCPDDVALDHIKQAAREFCTRTLCWNFACDPIDSQAGIEAYALQIEDDQELVRIDTVFAGHHQYQVRGAGRARRAAMRGTCERVASLDFGTKEIVLHPAPGDGVKIVVDVAVQPTMDAAEWPDLRPYQRYIAFGAISTLCALPEVTWTNGALAAAMDGKFEDKIREVAREVERGYSRGRRVNRVVLF